MGVRISLFQKHVCCIGLCPQSAEKNETKPDAWIVGALTVAAPLIAELPVQRLAVALFAEVVRERITTQETNKAIQFANAVLQWRTRETPFVLRL